MTRSAAERIVDVRRLQEAARNVIEKHGALVEAIVESTGLSAEGVELGLTRHVEVDARDAELAALVERAGDHPRVAVVLSANVFVGALRAIAIARAASDDVIVRPSRRDPAFARAFAKSQLAGGVTLPGRGAVFVSVKEADKPWIEEPVRLLIERGFTVLATEGTRRHLAGVGIPAEQARKVLEGRPHIVDQMKNGEVQLVFNTTEGRQSLEDSFSLRRAALMMKIPYYTTAAGALAAARAVGAMMDGTLEVRSLQEMA